MLYRHVLLLFTAFSTATVASSGVVLYQESFDGTVSQMMEGVTFEVKDLSEAPLKPSGSPMPWLFACGSFVGGPREIKGLYDSGELGGVASCNFASKETPDFAAGATAVATVEEQGTSDLTVVLVSRIHEQLLELDRIDALSAGLRNQLLLMREQVQELKQLQDLIRMSEQLTAVKELIPTGGPPSAPSDMAQPFLARPGPSQGVPLGVPALVPLSGLLELPPSSFGADGSALPAADAGPRAGLIAPQASPAVYTQFEMAPRVHPQAQGGEDGVNYLPVEQLPQQYAAMGGYAHQVGVAGLSYMPLEQLSPQYAPMPSLAHPVYPGQPPLPFESFPQYW